MGGRAFPLDQKLLTADPAAYTMLDTTAPMAISLILVFKGCGGFYTGRRCTNILVV